MISDAEIEIEKIDKADIYKSDEFIPTPVEPSAVPSSPSSSVRSYEGFVCNSSKGSIGGKFEDTEQEETKTINLA